MVWQADQNLESPCKNGSPYVIVDQLEESHRVGEDGGSVDVDLVAAVHERSEVHLEGSCDVIKGDPLAYNEPRELVV